MKDSAFAGFHPAVTFFYFAVVIAFSMFVMHPVYLILSVTGACACFLSLRGRRAFVGRARLLLPMMLLAALINPLFNHEGATILAYMPGGNPLTLESVAYGGAAALMLASVLLWFACFSEVMTSDKMIYLFGRVMPASSLLLSMALRFVPRFLAQLKAVAAAQKAIGRSEKDKSRMSRARSGLCVLSITVTWALENAICTADSMKSRGYGLSGRTAFSIFRFDARDRLLLTAVLTAGIYVLAGFAWDGSLYFRWFPSIRGAAPTLYGVSIYAGYGLLCLTPTILEGWEVKKWKRLRSKI